MTQGTQPAPAAFGRRLRLLTSPLAIVALLALFASPALGAKTHRLKASFGQSIPFGSGGVAVEEASGNVFNTDYQLSRVVINGPEGGAPSGVSPAEITGLTAPVSIAVDNSAISPSKGAVYVRLRFSGEVKKFVLEGGKYLEAGALSATPALGLPGGLAVDAKGNVFVADSGGKAVVEFGPTGTQLARFDVPASVGNPEGVAIDAAGDLFVKGSKDGGLVVRFAANGAGEVEAGTEPEQIVAPGSPAASGIAVDPSTDEFYVGMQSRVDQYDASCVPVGAGPAEHCAREGEFGSGTFARAYALAVNGKTGDVYVTNITSSAEPVGVDVFGPTVIVPGSFTGEASSLTGFSATLNGSVDPSGSEVTECKFEYGVESDPGSPNSIPPVPPTYTYAASVPCAETPAQIGAGNAPVAVHADLTGLGLGTTYHFRLLATSPTTVPNEKGPSVGADEAFTTLGPQIHGESLAQVSDTTAKVEGLVNPVGQATTYVVQYLSEQAFGEDGWDNALSVPAVGELIGSGTEDVKVAQQISGLVPNTAYRFRLAATNHCNPDPEEECVAFGPGTSFRTYAQLFTGLPDARVYEQVTPVDKNGAAATGNMGMIQAAGDGNALTYLSRGGIPGAEGAQKYPPYLATRGADWSTQGLLPPASGGSYAGLLGWSGDLSRAYLIQAPLPGSPIDFLERDNATRSLRTIAADGSNAFNYVGGTANGSVAIFEAEDPATKVTNAYLWDRASGETIPVGVLPNGSTPAKGTQLGAIEAFRRHYNQVQHTVSADVSKVFFTDVGSGQLYVRLNPASAEEECGVPGAACTVQVSASKRTVPDPLGKKPATFMAATPDGSKAFFTSPGKLTNDATTGPKDFGKDLYRYDVDSDELIDIAPDVADPNGAEVRGVLGVSDDGTHVYFAANGVLTSTPNAEGEEAEPGDCSEISPKPSGGGSGACNLYVWHNGETAFIAQLQLTPSYIAQPDSANWLWDSEEKTSRVSTGGQTLIFRSKRQLTAYDNQGVAEFYRYSAKDGELRCDTCDPTATSPVGPATLRSLRVRGDDSNPAAILTRNLSADGQRFFFETPDKLLAGDTNGDDGCPRVGGIGSNLPFTCQDVYEWEAQGSGSCHSDLQNGGCLYLISSGTSSEASYFADADTKGDNVFFYTLDPLVGQDKDQIVDIYDARVGGGIASQNPPPPAPVCLTTEACAGALPPSPATSSPGSASFSGPGNQKSSKQKKKKKKSHHKKKQKKRNAARKHR